MINNLTSNHFLIRYFNNDISKLGFNFKINIKFKNLTIHIKLNKNDSDY